MLFRTSLSALAGAVDAVFVIFVSVGVVEVVPFARSSPDSVEDDPGQVGAGFPELDDGALDGLAGCLVGADDKHDLSGGSGDVEGVADGIHRCAVDDDAVEACEEFLHERGDVGLQEEFGGIRGAAASREQGESLDTGLADQLVERRLSAQEVGEAAPLFTT